MHDPGQGLLLSTSRLRTRHLDLLGKAGLLSFDFRVGAEIAIFAQARGPLKFRDVVQRGFEDRWHQPAFLHTFDPRL